MIRGPHRGIDRDKRLPGTHEAVGRFVRGSRCVSHLAKPKSDHEAVAAMMSVMRNVSAYFGIADPGRPNISITIRRTVTDLTNSVLYSDSTVSSYVLWIDIIDL